MFRRLPSPEWILLHAPARSHLNSESVPVKRTADALCSLLNTQIAQGRQVGVQVCCYLNGELVVDVTAGVCRTRHRQPDTPLWKPVDPSTIFMSWSLCKGVAAASLLSLAEQGKVVYDQPVVSYWPEFAAIEHHTSEFANLKHHITVEEAVSHRAGLTEAPPLSTIFYNLWKGHENMWQAGLEMVENYLPSSPPGTSARYVPVMWSWVIGGIVERATGEHIRDVVRERIAAPLGEQEYMYMGCFPKESTAHVSKVAKWEMPHLAWSEALPGFVRSVWKRVSGDDRVGYSRLYGVHWWDKIVGLLESSLLVSMGNSRTIMDHCLPSSNGFFTANSVAKMYGALANQGRVGATQLFKPETVRELVHTIKDERGHLVNPKRPHDPARLSRGFSPWYDPKLQGKNANATLGHSGIGGCTAYGDPVSGLSVCIMRNSYQPLSLVGGSVSLDEYEICDTIRENLALE